MMCVRIMLSTKSLHYDPGHLVTAEDGLPSELPVCSGPGWGSGELPPLEWATHSADSGTLELEQRGELRDRRNCFRSVR